MVDTRAFQTLDDSDGGHSLPFGPLFMSPKSNADALVAVMTSEAHLQQIETLKSILALFDVEEKSVQAAFGNNESDSEAYESVGIENVFIVNSLGKIVTVAANFTSYNELVEDVDELFPPLNEN